MSAIAPRGPKVLETGRLVVRRFTLDDAAFIHELVNDPGWLEHIGDRKVRNLEDAREYLRKGTLAMYERHGFGMYLVELKATGEPAGTCGLIRREALEDVDIGFAFLPRFRGQGLAREAAEAVLEHGRADFGLRRIVAIVSGRNRASIRLLEALGLRFERAVKLPGEEPPIPLYAWNAGDAAPA